MGSGFLSGSFKLFEILDDFETFFRIYGQLNEVVCKVFKIRR